MDENEPGYGDVLRLMVLTGLRLGEATALRWADVDLDTASPWLHVRHAHSRGVLGPTKGKKERLIPLHPSLVLPLKERRLAAGCDPTAFVFARPDGRPINRNLIKHVHARGCGAAGRTIRVHDLRHTFGSLLARNTSMPVLRKLMGHTNLKTTMRYLHTDDDMAEQAIARLFRSWEASCATS